MSDPVADFKAVLVQRNPGEVHVYHIGHISEDAASSPTVANLQIFTHGLHLMGRVGLRQKNLMVGGERVTEYSLKVLQPIHPMDFDVARKAHLADLG
jgi:hypothetical protein